MIKRSVLVSHRSQMYINEILGRAGTTKRNLSRTLNNSIDEEQRRYRDELGDVTRMKRVGNRITDDLAESSVVYATTTTLEDYLVTNVQLNHDRELETPLRPHIHFWQALNAVPNFLLQYRWQVNLGLKTSDWISIPTVGVAKAYASGTLNQIAKFAEIPYPEGVNLSDIVQFRILRDNANTSGKFSGEDPYAASVHILSFDAHVKLDSNGSQEEYVK
jgi:hypothetical protein